MIFFFLFTVLSTLVQSLSNSNVSCCRYTFLRFLIRSIWRHICYFCRHMIMADKMLIAVEVQQWGTFKPPVLVPLCPLLHSTGMDIAQLMEWLVCHQSLTVLLDMMEISNLARRIRSVCTSQFYNPRVSCF